MLKFDSLTIKYADSSKPAVINANISLERGNLVGLVGESGSGKSTIVNTAMGVLPKSAEVNGAILIDGTDVLRCSSSELSKIRWEKIALIPQGAMNSFTPVLSVGKHIREVLKTHLGMTGETAEKKIDELLQSVELSSDIKDRYPHELSGGQKQRAAIATALACSPQALLADEPTTALDVVTQAGILKLLVRLKEKNKISILLVTHDLPMAASVCDSLAVMKDGEIVERGSAEEIVKNPKQDYTKKLISSMNLPPKTTNSEKSNETVLSAENVTVKFVSKNGRSHTAVNSVSLSLNRGGSLAIVGESGSGKTTLLRALMGLAKTDSGTIKLFGGESSQNAETKRRCGYIPQDPYGALPPGLSVLEAVMEPYRIAHRRVTEEAKQRAFSLLKEVGLTEDRILRARAIALSGGQRQRVEIARALMLSPEILLCDEPTSMQDVSTREDIIDILNRRADAGMSMIFVTHDLMLAASVSNYIIVMRNGTVCETGESAKVLSEPSHEYTKALLQSMPVIKY